MPRPHGVSREHSTALRPGQTPQPWTSRQPEEAADNGGVSRDCRHGRGCSHPPALPCPEWRPQLRRCRLLTAWEFPPPTPSALPALRPSVALGDALPNSRLLSCEHSKSSRVPPGAHGHRAHVQVSPGACGHPPAAAALAKCWLGAAARLNSQNHGTLFIVNSD